MVRFVRGPKQNRKAGGAYVITHNNNILYKQKTPVITPDITIAELTALTQAADTLNSNIKQFNTNHNNIIFFCDNKFVVKLANDITQCKYKYKSDAMQLQQLLFDIRQQSIVKIEWILAHCDIKLHDLADQLAGECANDATSVL